MNRFKLGKLVIVVYIFCILLFAGFAKGAELPLEHRYIDSTH